MSLHDYTDDALASRFNATIRIVWFEGQYWQRSDEDGWQPVPKSTDPNLVLLEPIRHFCREVADGDPFTNLTNAQVERLMYRLGQLSTFRNIHKLINKQERRAPGKEWADLTDTYLQYEVAFITPPIAVADFTTSYAPVGIFGDAHIVSYKGKQTGFKLKGQRAPTFGSREEPPFNVIYGHAIRWRGEYPTLDKALAATIQIIRGLHDDPAGAGSSGLRVIQGGAL